MENPTTEHMVAVKRVLRYIAGTLHFGCYYQRKKEAQLIGYCDADLAGDIDTRKSTTGVLYFLGSSIITWQSQKQKVVALSSCEAEYMLLLLPAKVFGWPVSLLNSGEKRSGPLL